MYKESGEVLRYLKILGLIFAGNIMTTTGHDTATSEDVAKSADATAAEDPITAERPIASESPAASEDATVSQDTYEGALTPPRKRQQLERKDGNNKREDCSIHPRIRQLFLDECHKTILKSQSLWLDDTVCHAAQMLLKQDFLYIEGLHPPPLVIVTSVTSVTTHA